MLTFHAKDRNQDGILATMPMCETLKLHNQTAIDLKKAKRKRAKAKSFEATAEPGAVIPDAVLAVHDGMQSTDSKTSIEEAFFVWVKNSYSLLELAGASPTISLLLSIWMA